LTDVPSVSSAELISSRRNPLVRQWRQLQESKGRREQGLLLLEGTHLLQEVLRLQLRPQAVVATDDWVQRHPGLVVALAPLGGVQRVSAEVLAAIATTRHPDGVALTLPPPPTAALDGSAAANALWLVLDTIQDPGNLGTLMRTALAARVRGLWLVEGADPFQPKVLRASAGAALELPIWRGERATLAAHLAQVPPSLQVVATLPPAAGAEPYWQLDWTRPTVLMLGSEGAGLAEDLQTLASHRVTVPHSPAVESLNVAVAAAPLLLERQRQQISAAGGIG
jgi:TrmH family RNA methyltransferase